MRTFEDSNITALWNKVKAYVNARAPIGAVAAKDIVPVEMGGTGVTTVEDIKEKLNCVDKDSIEFGFIGTESIASQSYRDVTITFTKVFSKAPRVFLQLGSTSASSDIGSISAVLSTFPTTTGFSVRIFNNASASRSPSVHWTAVECD